MPGEIYTDMINRKQAHKALILLCLALTFIIAAVVTEKYCMQWKQDERIGKSVSEVLIEKEKHKSFLSYWSFDDYRGLLNDLDGGIRFQPRGYLFENGREYLIELKDAIRFKAYVNSNDFENAKSINPEKKKIFKEMTDNLNETDNPVLMIVKLKK